MTPTAAAAGSSRPWLDAGLPPAERARLLAAAMTPAELAGQLMADDASASAGLPGGLPADDMGCLYNARGARLALLARALRQRSRLNVPVLFAMDCIHGHGLAENLGGTVFPSPLAMAASFDRAQLHAMGRVTGDEMVASGIRWNFSPNLDVVRDLRFGRVEEMLGEDPFLVGELGAAYIEALQGDAARPRVLATAKHVTGYSEGSGARDAAECAVSWRVLRRDHLPPVRRAVEAGVRAVMSGYHAIDGVPCVVNQRLLRHELRDQLGFDGFVVSDADNVRWCTLLQSLQGEQADFIVRALQAGNEVQLAATGVVEALVAAVDGGRLPLEVLRDAAALFLGAKFALGLFDAGDAALDVRPPSQLRTAASLAAAVEAAASSMVLLENRGVLPLAAASSATAGQRILLVGTLADDLRQQLGCWTLLTRNDAAAEQIAKQPEAAEWTFRAALQARAAKAGAVLTWEPGCGPAPTGSPAAAAAEQAEMARAVAAAAGADVVVAIVGDSDHWAGEGRDRADLGLPGRQLELLQALHASGKPLVVVLAVTKPLALPWVQANAAAVVCAWSAGMGGGAALAALLWGDHDFAGRTPVTWPAHVGQMPLHYDRLPGAHFEGFSGGPNDSVPKLDQAPGSAASRDLHVWRQAGARHIDLPAAWVFGLWPFGHGLSYAPVHIASACMQQPRYAVGATPVVSVQLHNPGPRSGVAVVQVYVRDVAASVTRPDRRLAGWAKLQVAAGGQAMVDIALATACLEVVDADGRRVTEPGAFHALVGLSSLVTELRVLPFDVEDGAHTTEA